MDRTDFFRGMGIGLVTGAAIGVAIMPKKRSLKSSAGKTIRAVSDVVENISSAMGM